MPDAEIAAVGSRSQEAADAFGDRFGIPHRHAGYQALADDSDVDLVYIATPHALHHENSILCLQAGKGVLCEKPFTINRREAEDVIAIARTRKLFLMEAMWTRFIPAVQQALRWVEAGEIGDVRTVDASFGFRADPAEGGPLFDPALGGGSLLDVGIYPITLAHMVFGGLPSRIESKSIIGKSGVDEQASLELEFDGGGVARLNCAITAEMPGDAYIAGTEGTIRLHDSFWNATRVSIQRGHGAPEVHEFPLAHNGYEYEAHAAQECFRAGEMECETMPHAATLEVLDIMDAARAQWGLKYPME
jgi:predicted dehydrogenase